MCRRRRRFGSARSRVLWNLTGQPAISLQLDQSAGGLPIGVQLVGPPAGDALLLQLAGQIEAATPWVPRQPIPWPPAQ